MRLAMPPRLSRADALEDISGWSTPAVVAFLQKNGLEEACWKAVDKRQIDGDELLHLTEGKLALWKSDLTRPLIWSLWTFVEEVKKSPEKYVEAKQAEEEEARLRREEQETALSDTGSWDTDFEEGPADAAEAPEEPQQTHPDFRSSLRLFQENDRITRNANTRGSTYSIDRVDRSSQPATENTYANCEAESTYANVGYGCEASPTPSEDNLQGRNSSILHSGLAEKLKEQLKLIGVQPTSGKPAVTPKPAALRSRTREEAILGRRGEPRTSFLHKSAKANGNHVQSKAIGRTIAERANGTAGTEPADRLSSSSTEETLRNLPKPPVSLRGFDLVANLPTTRLADESEDDEEDYEAFDEQLVERHRRNSISRTDSRQSLASARPNSVESVYQPPSSISHDEEEEVYEIYESITESPDENTDDFKNDSDSKTLKNPPPLPAKPPTNVSPLQNHVNKIDSETGGPTRGGTNATAPSVSTAPGSTAVPAEEPTGAEPAPVQNLATLSRTAAATTKGGIIGGLRAKMAPLVGESKRATITAAIGRRQTSLSECLTQESLAQARQNLAKRSPEKSSATLPHAGSNTSLSNAARPLPPPPDRRPWFHNLTREQANLLIEEQCTYGNSSDGFFLMRPSTSNPNNPLTLVLWCGDRVYNVPVRRRPDNRYALGSSKPKEESFASIDDIIPFYKKEKLILYTNGVQTGSTTLSDTPQKEK